MWVLRLRCLKTLRDTLRHKPLCDEPLLGLPIQQDIKEYPNHRGTLYQSFLGVTTGDKSERD